MLNIHIKLSLREIIIMSIFFTILAVYMNIHEDKIVYDFLADHILSLGIALIVSRIIYEIFQKRK
jgi:hypothetical protein